MRQAARGSGPGHRDGTEYVRQLPAAGSPAAPSLRNDADFVLEFKQGNIWDRQSPEVRMLVNAAFTFGPDDEDQ
ncbi:hypothetical protein ABZ570_25235 [Micromonospora sp. NPDC007271]|uniref:hypothetical protein n=1 Tax=Micromonospora sp. NPDC007271 TaxID=3154587 RepID=UPI0034017CFE